MAAVAVETELTELSVTTEHLFDVDAEMTRHAVALRDARKTADLSLRIFVDLNTELRRTQEALRTTRRDAQHKRERWIDLEQYISEAPERRKRIAEQVAQREAQEEVAAKKVVSVQRALSEAHVFHNEALTQDKKSETALNLIETITLDLDNWAQSSSSSSAVVQKSTESQNSAEMISEDPALPEERGTSRSAELAQICSRLPSYLREQQELKEILENLGNQTDITDLPHSFHQLNCPKF